MTSFCTIPTPRQGQTIVADLRYCVTASPNSAAAVAYASETFGIRHVLLEATFIPASGQESATCLFHPPFIEEYKLAATMPWHEWFEAWVVRGGLHPGDLANEIFFVPEIDSFWIMIDCAEPNDIENAIAAVRDAFEEEAPDAKLFFVFPNDPKNHINDVVAASPSGAYGFKFLALPSRIDLEYAVHTREAPVIPKTFSFDQHPSAEICVYPLP